MTTNQRQGIEGRGTTAEEEEKGRERTIMLRHWSWGGKEEDEGVLRIGKEDR